MLQSTSLQKSLRAHRLWLALFGALVGVAAFLCIHTAASLNVTYEAWILDGYVEKDILQHYTGWLFYRDAPLRFPLGISQSMQHPAGTAVTFTDSVPLFSIALRLFETFLPETFQFFGWFTLACYAAMGAAATLLLSLFLCALPRVPADICALLGAALFVTYPIVTERAFRHTALVAQAFVVFALFLYFANRKEGFRLRGAWFALTVLSATIHPYFVPMVYAVLFADLLAHALHARQKRAWLHSAAFLTANGVATVLALFCIGAFSSPASDGISGYSYFCMNLNSLYNPVSRGGMGDIVWSRVLPTLPQGLGTYDGFNYLGLGVLAFGAAALVWQAGRLLGLSFERTRGFFAGRASDLRGVTTDDATTSDATTSDATTSDATTSDATTSDATTSGAATSGATAKIAPASTRMQAAIAARAHLLDRCKRHGALLLVCAALTVFALSNVLVLNDAVLLSLPIPGFLSRLGNVLRSSGRLFWPVSYLALLATVVFWARCFASRTVVAGKAPATAHIATASTTNCAAATAAVPATSAPSATSALVAALTRLRPFLPVLALTALLALQLWDLSPALAQKRAAFTRPEAEFTNPMQSAVWDAATVYDHVFSLDDTLTQALYPALWAAQNGLTTNDGFTARFDFATHRAEVAAQTKRLLAGTFDSDTLYLTCDYARFAALANALQASGANVTCAWIDGIWYAILPNRADLALPAPSDSFAVYPSFPLLLAPLTDALWADGVLLSDPRTCIFYAGKTADSAFERATALVCEGTAYNIVSVDTSDAGWVMVTLDIPDASVLRDKPLQTR